MAITDLTGTMWVINENPDVTSNFAIEISYTSLVPNETYDIMAVNTSYYSGVLMYRDQSSGAAKIAYRGDTSSWTNEAYRTVTFTSEVTEDSGYLTQTEFITWLEANAVQVLPDYIDKVSLISGDEYYFKDTISGYLSSGDLVAGTNISIEEDSEGKAVISSSSNARVRIIRLPEPTISDLTGTTWLINSTPDVSSNWYVDISFSYGGGLSRVTFAVHDPYIYYYTDTTVDEAYLDGTGWADESYRTVTFNGNVTAGDKFNDEFIEWLLTNATQVS